MLVHELIQVSFQIGFAEIDWPLSLLLYALIRARHCLFDLITATLPFVSRYLWMIRSHLRIRFGLFYNLLEILLL